MNVQRDLKSMRQLSANKEIEFRKLVAVLSLNLLYSIILSTEVLVLE